MNKRSNKILSKLAKVRFLSPEGFLVCALVIAITFAGMEALGLRSSMTALTGTNPTASPAAPGLTEPAICTACLYLLCYLAFAGLVPIFLLGSIFLPLLNLIIAIVRRKGEHL